MAAPQYRPIRRDWWSKSLAGLLCGAALALACSRLFVQFNPGMALSVRGQLAMWMVAPIWLGVLSTVYCFASGLRAWLWLGSVSLLSGAVCYAARLF